MALGLELALVLRAKGGANFLLQTHGIGAKDANEATREAAEVLGHYAEVGGVGNVDSDGDNAPGFSAGELLVGMGRLRVVYRLVNAVWVMTVAPESASVLLCMQLIDATIRVLIAASKGVDVTPDKLAKRYPEVFVAAGMVLKSGSTTFDAARMLAVAEAEITGIAPETSTKGKGTTAAIKNRLAPKTSLSRPSATSSASPSSSQQNLAADFASNRGLGDEGDYLGQAGFALPEDALTPQAFAEPSAPSERPASASASAASAQTPGMRSTMDELLSPSMPVPGMELLAGTGLETLDVPVAGYGDAYGALRPPPPPPVSENPWAHFDAFIGAPASANQTPGQQEASGWVGGPGQEVQSRAVVPEEKPVLPPPTAKEQRAVANGNALQLVELWRAAFVGTGLIRAGLQGEVLGTGAVSNSSAEAAFVVQAVDAASKVVTSALSAAHSDPRLTSKGSDGTSVAHLGLAPAGEAAFLTYKLPAVVAAPPILVHVAAVHSKPATGSPKGTTAAPQTMLVVSLAAHPELAGALRGLVVDLDVPASLGEPAKVVPRSQWAKSQRRLRWELGVIAPGETLTVRSVFASVTQGPQDSRKALATVHAYGPVGLTLSRATLQSGAESGLLSPSRAAFHCEVVARPAQ